MDHPIFPRQSGTINGRGLAANSPIASTIKAPRSRKKTKHTEWQRRIRLLLTTNGKEEDKANDLKPTLSKMSVISGSWPTSMPARRQRLNVSFTIPAVFTASVKCMKALRRWTSWSKSVNVESRSHPLRRPSIGKGARSTSSTPRPRRLHDRSRTILPRSRWRCCRF